MAKLPYVDQNGLVRVWSKVKEYVQTAISGLYTKPLDGIPSTDMTTEVQTSLGKADTALQSFTETDPTVPAWAKAAEKPTYTAEEVGALPDDTELFSGSYDDLTDKPTIPEAQVQADWGEADSTKVDYIKNKPSLATVATSGSYNDLSNTPTIPTVPAISTDISADGTSDAKTASPKAVKTFVEGKGYITSAHEVPSGGNAGQVLSKNSATDYDVHWVSQTTTYPSAYCTTAGGTALKVANCSLWTATANTYLHILMGVSNTYQGELKLKVNSNPSAAGAPIYINGVVSSSTNYTLPSGSYIIFYDGTNFYFNTDGTIPNVLHKSSTSGLVKNDGSIDTNTYLTQHQDISNYVQKSNTTGLLKNDGSVDTNTYLTSAPVTSVNGQTGAVSLSIPTESTVSGWGFTKNAGTITGVTMNGASKGTSGVVDLGTVITSHQDISGKENTSNKVTSLSSSSTDTEYPSAKCVYDLVGDIETILASI